MLAVVVADAPDAHLHGYLPLFSDADLVIAADGGTRHVLRHGITPHVIIGDLDSIDPATLNILEDRRVEIIRHRVDKDETDLELAMLLAVQRGAQRIRILAALGGRPDMHVANQLLLAHPQVSELDIALLDQGWEIRIIRQAMTIADAIGQRLSLVPLGDVHGITTTGLQFPLHNETLLGDAVRGVSNVIAASPATITIASGILLLFREQEPSATGNHE